MGIYECECICVREGGGGWGVVCVCGGWCVWVGGGGSGGGCTSVADSLSMLFPSREHQIPADGGTLGHRAFPGQVFNVRTEEKLNERGNDCVIRAAGGTATRLLD